MQNYILIGINLISITGLVIIILKPEWIDKFRLKFGIETLDQEQILPSSTRTPNELNHPNIDNFNDKKKEIIAKLTLARYDFLDTTTNGQNNLTSVIDNILDYLNSITPMKNLY